MNIFYEESGQFKVAAVVQKNDSTYQATTQHGKRAKIKANNVFVEFTEPMDAFLERAQAEAAQIDTDLRLLRSSSKPARTGRHPDCALCRTDVFL